MFLFGFFIKDYFVFLLIKKIFFLISIRGVIVNCCNKNFDVFLKYYIVINNCYIEGCDILVDIYINKLGRFLLI